MDLIKTSFFAFLLLCAASRASGADPADTCSVTAPVLFADRTTTCAGEPVLLWAQGCAGTVHWSSGLQGDTIVSRPSATRVYSARCKTQSCESTSSGPLTVTVPVPDIPVLSADTRAVCPGGSAVLVASNCPGEVVWSNGRLGREITVRPAQTTRYTAVCRTGERTCVSCFAEAIEIRVTERVRPVLVASQTTLCASDSLSLQVEGCSGRVLWADGIEGKLRTRRPQTTTTYEAVCRVGDCAFPTNPVTVHVGPPSPPTLMAERTTLCYGESVRVAALGCAGKVLWSDGSVGDELRIMPQPEQVLTARCEAGGCLGPPSPPLHFTVRPKVPVPTVRDHSNVCPYVTVDLSRAVAHAPPTREGQLVYKLAPSAGAADVENPAVVGAGTYYVLQRDPDECYSEPASVNITIVECVRAVPVCTYYPPTVRVEVDSLASPWQLRAFTGGSAEGGRWSTNGSGTFGSAEAPATTYTPSDRDRAAGRVSLGFSTDDPDGEGVCEPATFFITLTTRPPDRTEENPYKGTAGTELEPIAPAAEALTPDLFVPEGFSPNGDGVNDRLVLGNVPAGTSVFLEVYNRWGQLVHREANYRNDWDGRANRGAESGTERRDLPDGTYFSIIRLSDGRQFVKFLTLLR